MLVDRIFCHLGLRDQWAVLLDVLLIQGGNILLAVVLPSLHHGGGGVLVTIGVST